MTAPGGVGLVEGVSGRPTGEATVSADKEALGEEDRGRMMT